MGRSGDRSQQRRRFRCRARLPAPRRPTKLLPILPHDRGCRFQPNADAATLVDIGAFGGYSPDNVLGSEYRRHLAATLNEWLQAIQTLVLNVFRAQACSLSRVIPEIDIWRAANLMLKRRREGPRGKRRSSRSKRITTAQRCGAGSPTPSSSSRTRHRPVRCTDHLASRSAAGLIFADFPLGHPCPAWHLASDNVLYQSGGSCLLEKIDRGEKENRTRSDGHSVAATCPNRGRIVILPPSRRDFSGQSRSISQPRGPALGPEFRIGPKDIKIGFSTFDTRGKDVETKPAFREASGSGAVCASILGLSRS